ncbi:MAG TPA: NADH-quinone oxidoreductase subunit L [Verrucomicrobiae bacterium]|nr:NADH-quinone oxidoreductase subunit L [Verrucomicrobiae bacterium]
MNLLAFTMTGFSMTEDHPICSVWLTLFAPLVAAVLITLFTQRSKGLSALLSIGAVLLGFVLSLRLFLALAFHGQQHVPHTIPWLTVGNMRVEFGMTTDALAMLMLLVVTGVGSAIHIYSLGYMKGDPGFSRYFACMSLFTFSMLGIVIANNFIQMFIFWELVGLSSYLLIGFWFEKPSAAEAGKKAFLVTRIGDFGMMLGILLLWSYAGTFNFRDLQVRLPALTAASGTVTPATLALIGALIFCGAIGKSAQFPLHVWLPDAMEGPTPVSALIHAATMVAAGVYMLCRVFFLIAPSGVALTLIAWIGGITALMAAIIAIAQNDIKRILAYSTLSQLGYMVMAVGLGGPTPAMFHLTMHAFFKALLFLAAGSVIIGLHHEQDIWKMGGLWKKMPITFWTFLIAALALAGVPPLSGFYSKDEILVLAFDRNRWLFGMGVGAAVLTAFYIGREVFVVFCGKPRDRHAYDHAHESPLVMTLPLIFLGILSVIGGWGSRVPEFLSPSHLAEHHAPVLSLGLIAAPAVGFALAWILYWKPEPSDAPVESALGTVYVWIQNKFYFDELYLWIVKYVQGTIAAVCDWFDRWILQRLCIGGLSQGTGLLGRTVRLLQTGSISGYAFLFALGVTVIIYYVVVR